MPKRRVLRAAGVLEVHSPAPTSTMSAVAARKVPSLAPTTALSAAALKVPSLAQPLALSAAALHPQPDRTTKICSTVSSPSLPKTLSSAQVSLLFSY